MSDPLVVDRAETSPTTSAGRTFVAILVGALLAAGVLGQLTDADTPPPQSSQTPQVRSGPVPATRGPEFAGVIDLANAPAGQDFLRLCDVPVGGLILTADPPVPGWTVESWDCSALEGPWSIVVRGTGGHLGFRSAVVTYPVAHPGTGTPTRQPLAGMWDSRSQELVWPLAGAHAKIAGDLGLARLADLASRVSSKGGRPHLSTPGGFTVSAAMTSRAPVVHEMRYSTVELGQESALGKGLVHTGSMSGGAFETEAFRAHATPAGRVRGRPAIGYEVRGRQAALAWEPSPGTVLYVGFRGSSSAKNALEALRALAEKGRELTAAQWKAKDRTSGR